MIYELLTRFAGLSSARRSQGAGRAGETHHRPAGLPRHVTARLRRQESTAAASSMTNPLERCGVIHVPDLAVE